MDWFSKAKGHNRVQGHAAVRKVEIRTLVDLAFPLESRAECLNPFDTQALGVFDCGLRKGAVEHIFPVLVFGVREEAETGSVFAEALV
jgi:hypothetical protein